MRVAVDFQNERLEVEVPEDRLVADWHGPAGVAGPDVLSLVGEVLESPRQFPPLRQAVVPGDRVVIALDAEVPALREVLAALCETLGRAGVEAGDVTYLVAPGALEGVQGALPAGGTLAVHDPDDRKQLAYLATTSTERRIYLNRLLTDADVVIPVGRLGYDGVLGYRGPWGLLFPGLSDTATARDFRVLAKVDWPDAQSPRSALSEVAEVSWLLGSQFHLGIVAGISGAVEVVAGAEAVVLAEGTRAVDHAWTFEAGSRADLVVVGVGRPGVPTRIEELAEGLVNASRLVQRGGKIVALSRAEGPIGPALHRLIEVDDPRHAAAALRGLEAEPDYNAAQQFARALAWADVYLFSGLDPEAIEDSSLIAIGRPEEVRRLAATSHSCLFLSQAELARARVAGED